MNTDHTPTIVRKLPDSFQGRVYPWTVETFGLKLTLDLNERIQRFLEEALELVQAAGGTQEQAVKMAAYVFSRPVGEVHQEAAGTQVSLAALCNRLNVPMDECREVELLRCIDNAKKIREKQKTKPRF